MDSTVEIWKMLAGVAIFLLGMRFMEEGLRSLAGRKFKLFLKDQTSNKLKAIGGGAIITGLLQSSSITNLLVLSLVGASVIKMQNALAVILGSNLGSTVNSLILVTMGFKFDIDSFALPAAAITGIAITFTKSESSLFYWSKFLFGLSLIFIALGYIKEGMTDVVRDTDLSRFNQYPVIVFVLLGIVLTGLVQSSSATMVITLSALYANAITLFVGTAIVLGSEIGTTLKLFIASAKGLPAKKRVALGNFLFNVITVAVIFVFLRPLNNLITGVLKIEDNLIALVLFQVFVNFAAIILFYPFLNAMGRFLESKFISNEDETMFIHKVPVSDSELAMEALEKETRHFIFHVIGFNLNAFELVNAFAEEKMDKSFSRKPLMEKYEYIKRLHGEIHGFCIRLQSTSSFKKEVERFERLVSAVRNCMYAAKSIRDALHDIEHLRNSSNDTKYNFYMQTKNEMSSFYDEIISLLRREDISGYSESMTRIFRKVQHGYTQSLSELYREGMAKHVNDLEISTLINFNREMYTSFKSTVFALKDYLLNPKDADYFENLPGFIR